MLVQLVADLLPQRIEQKLHYPGSGHSRRIGERRADLLLIDGDPVSDLTALQRMSHVFKAGVGYRTQAIFDALRGKVGLY